MPEDLKTAIPLVPFEEFHEKRDIPFGTPAEPETESKGYMPFTWIQNGVRVSADPIRYDMFRAALLLTAMEKWYSKFDALCIRWGSNSGRIKREWNKYLDNTVYQQWRQLNAVATLPYDDGDKVGWVSKDQVWYGDKFSKFINAIRSGNVSEADNNLTSI